MATKEDVKKEELDESADAPAPDEDESASSEASADADEKPAKGDEAEKEEKDAGPVAAPTQLGHRRFVYAAYFAGAIAIAFVASKVISIAWARLGQWKPTLGEPRDDLVMPVSALIALIAAVYYWRRTRARQLAEQVAEELSKVTWPDRKEVTNSTFVVIVTTIVSTIFFALMDRFWGFVTNLVYGT